jgi:hypothetical protein
MKTLIIIGFCAALWGSLAASAQTFVNYKVTTFDTNGIGSVTFNVPTNTLFKVKSWGPTASQPSLIAIYPESTNQVYYQLGLWGGYGSTLNPEILGPATVIYTGGWPYQTTGGILILMGEFDVVNTAPALTGFAVQPNGQGASIQLQTSTDLTTWCAATNGTYDASAAARFYRMAFQVTP